MRISDWSSDVCSSDLEAGVGAVNEVRLAVREQPMLRQVENQDRPHAVVGETLPHFGEEEHVEALGVAGELGLLAPGDQCANAQERSEERRVGKEGISTCRSRWYPYQ